MFEPGYLQRAIIAAPAILFALTVHEFFHAWTAHRFGDNTARDMGRLTLNPLAHLDIFGTLMLFLSQFRFGWAKPVPVNPMNMRNPRVADIWVAAAGPLSNMGLALIFGVIFRGLAQSAMQIPQAVGMFLFYSVSINVSLAFFNLIPLFPLDGSHILRNLLPPQFDEALDRLNALSPFILMLLIIVGAFGVILGPFVRFFVELFAGIRMG